VDPLPHLALPIRVANGLYGTVEQDTLAELGVTVTTILRFERGTRPEQANFGITDPTFQQMPVDTAELETQVATFEPRARLTVTTTDQPNGQTTVQVAVSHDEED
jgi:phage baseplate assembly protein W